MNEKQRQAAGLPPKGRARWSRGQVVTDEETGGTTAIGQPLPRLSPTKFARQRVDTTARPGSDSRAAAMEAGARPSRNLTQEEAEKENLRQHTAVEVLDEDGEPTGVLSNGLPKLRDDQLNPARTAARTRDRGGKVVKVKVRGLKDAGGDVATTTIRIHDAESSTVLFPYDLEARRRGEPE